MSAAYARSIAGLGHGAPPARGRRAPRRVAAAAAAVGPSPEAVEAAYTACEASTRASSATFHFATLLMRPTQRRSVQAIYAWCRELDETVDGVEALRAPKEEADRKLSAIEADLRAMFVDDDTGGGPVVAPSSAPETIALADTIRRTPGLEAGPFLDMIAGMRSDLAVTLDGATGLPSRMFDDWPALREYCYRVAGTVGLMTLPVMGTADGYTVEQASAPGIELGIALQLTNILRDVGEDARRGRLYLPLDAVYAAGLTPREILDGCLDERYESLIEGEIRRAEAHFERARGGVRMLAPAARLPVLAAAEVYGALLQKVRENGYDNHTKRAYTTNWEKLRALPGLVRRAWFET
jgi:phytoene synthase